MPSEGPHSATLIVDVEGATVEQLKRGMAAAMAVFEGSGCTPDAAASARFEIECWDHSDCDDELALTEEQWRIRDVWDEADEAAVKACCDGWTTVPKNAGISLEFDAGASPAKQPSER